MKSNKIILTLIIGGLLIIIISCKQNYTPKPYGYFRIDLPKKEYKKHESEMPFSFEVPNYAFVINDSINKEWSNIDFPLNNARIYMTYKNVENNFSILSEEAREFVYKHTVKADAIKESYYGNEDEKVYGILYDIKGNAASSVQFFLTDSTKHFVRASLYFNNVPNKDSLAPVIEFIREDIVHLIETFAWE
ncbi:MAG: gliding motility lipoprotein GldD [Bacteroidales bacterium]|nr:gliding motility lipoprotein GldD [Bacteroidales bacterium]